MQATCQSANRPSVLPLKGMSDVKVAANLCVVEGPSQNVYIIGEDLPVCEASIQLLSPPNVRVHRFGSAGDYLKHGNEDEPGCVIIDLLSSVDSGVDLQQKLGRETCHPIIFISGGPDIEAAVRAMKAGAISILCEPIDSAELVEAVREALAQDRNRRVRKTELEKLARRFSLLTPRERDVLPLIIGGLLNKEAASILGISEVTLQIHRSHVMQKMEASSIAELVRMALRLRIPHWRADTRGSKLVVHSSGS